MLILTSSMDLLDMWIYINQNCRYTPNNFQWACYAQKSILWTKVGQFWTTQKLTKYDVIKVD